MGTTDGSRSNGRDANWPAMVGAGTLLIVLGGLFQTQLASIYREMELIRIASEKGDSELLHSRERIEIEIKDKLVSIQAELDRRRDEFTNEKEFRRVTEATKDSIDLLRKQLSVIEAARPNASELQAQIFAINERLKGINARITVIDSFISEHMRPSNGGK